MVPHTRMMERTAWGYDDGVAAMGQLRLAAIATREAVVCLETKRNGALRYSRAGNPYKNPDVVTEHSRVIKKGQVMAQVKPHPTPHGGHLDPTGSTPRG